MRLDIERPMTDRLLLAHLSDVHLGPIRGFTPRYWNAKRLTGFVNWMRHRRHSHSRDLADRLVADALGQAPDHIAVTGDLANIGLPQEHADALAWLSTVGSPEQVTVVPGNHDIYARIGRDAGTGRWSEYMAPFAVIGATNPREAGTFPFIRRFGRFAVIGVNSAVRTPPLAAWGRVGEPQRRALASDLDRLGREGLIRVVLIHHPPLVGQAGPMRGLQDAAEVERVLTNHGAELVLHGHNHRNMLEMRTTREGGKLAVIGVPSASLRHAHGEEPAARYNLLRIESSGAIDAGQRGPVARVHLIGRGLTEPDGPIVEIERRAFEIGAIAR